MTDFFDIDYRGPAFTLFGPSHCAALIGVFLVCLLVALAAPRLDTRGQAALRWSLLAVCIICWLGWDAWQIAYGVWTPAYSLPLHICTLSVPLAALMLATRSYRLFEVLYFWAFTASVVAMLVPDLQASRYDFPHFRFLIFFISHGSILWAVLAAAGLFSYRPTWRSLLNAVAFTTLYMACVGVVNWLTGGNYMYVARPPDFATPIDYLGPWPWYLLGLEAIGIAAFTLAYLPYAAADAWRGRAVGP